MEIVNRRAGPRAKRLVFRDPTGKLDEKEYDYIVRKWNSRGTKRRAVRAECLSDGHLFREAPFSDLGDEMFVCVRCCDYRRERV